MVRRWGTIGAALFVFAGCATVERPQVNELLWPPSPLTPRIKFVGLLRNQTDLGRSAGELFAEALLGRKKAEDSIGQPMAIAASRDGQRVYVTDYAKGTVFVFDFELRRVSRFGDEAHGFRYPFGIAVDDKDNVYVADSSLKTISVFDRSGKFLRELNHNHLLERPTGIAIDPVRRRMYVIDSSHRTSQNHMLHTLDLDNGGQCLRHFGGVGDREDQFFFPTYVALDRAGNVYVTDTLNARVQVFDPDGRYLRTIGQRGDSFGMFDKPKGVAVDSFGNAYVVDSTWSNVQIFNPRGEILLYFAGRGQFPGLLFNPTGIAIDRDNRIYVADAFNGRVAVYQLINTKAEDSFLTQTPRSEKGGALAGSGAGEEVRKAQKVDTNGKR